VLAKRRDEPYSYLSPFLPQRKSAKKNPSLPQRSKLSSRPWKDSRLFGQRKRLLARTQRRMILPGSGVQGALLGIMRRWSFPGWGREKTPRLILRRPGWTL